MSLKKSQEKNEPVQRHEIDATGMPYGRLASTVTTLIRGKNSPSFEPNKIPNVEVLVKNLNKARISDKKLDLTSYYRTSGYPGGMKEHTWRKLFDKDPRKLFMKVLDNMLPSNRLKKQLLKKVKFQ